MERRDIKHILRILLVPIGKKPLTSSSPLTLAKCGSNDEITGPRVTPKTLVEYV